MSKIVQIHGDILEDTLANFIVCPVNCVGVMGAGLAQEISSAFPDQCDEYYRACADGDMQPGSLVVEGRIIHVATKNHWSMPSQIEWVTEGICGIVSFVEEISSFGITVAVPMLGCGLGGLREGDVWHLMRRYFTRKHSDAVYRVYR